VAFVAISKAQSPARIQNKGQSAEPTNNFDSIDELWQAKRTEARDRALDEWRTPIEFYGKVVDESENPVEGAKIAFGWTDLSVEGYSKAETVSDAAGLFNLRGKSGKHLSVEVSKDGYYISRRNTGSFYYAGQDINFTPDAASPVVFRLKKKGAAEELIATSFPGFAKIAKLPRDGTPFEIDLAQGRKAAAGSGHLKLELTNCGDSGENSQRIRLDPANFGCRWWLG
jgi:hypothetical protein